MAKKPESESFVDMFSNFGRDLKMPNVDIEAILNHHRKNLEALQKSAAASASGAQDLMAKQRQILQDTMSEITDMAQSYRAPGNPQEMMTKQAEFVRRSFETAVKNASEAAEIIKKSGTESVEVLRERIRETMEEIRQGYEKNR
ncbi:phasin family protein [Allomesorhizobium alhagi]|jgi:phasin family protein|uniref:Phasin family protein n=1 Tax=Mesorhizobium alhagi CCNWXJ12-2 TaxID=1107882 RepID=H0HSR5_9HYPH|nr:TIGR01841 family phasin [Mesorhizobium alhagi]EHK56253.1 phasin family protein [Mesorhizobium alhagi CCNWXJ12-2]